VPGPEEFWGDQGPPSSGREALTRLWQIGRDAADKKREVRDAVRAERDGKSRDELRRAFEIELTQRGMPQDPSWVERTLDDLELSSAEKRLRDARNLLLVGRTLGGLARSRGIPEPPAWMQPPEQASYQAPGGGNEVPVVIDPDQTGHLDRVIASAPGHVGNMAALVPVWFDWDSDHPGAPRVAVHIGSTRVGALDRNPSQAFAPVMRAAEERDAKPREEASLERAKHLDPPYILAVTLPAEGWFDHRLRSS